MSLTATETRLLLFAAKTTCEPKLAPVPNSLYSRHHTNYADFHAHIDQCLNDLPTKHKAAMATMADGGCNSHIVILKSLLIAAQ
ncbi:MAG: hypothetical protein WD872_01300, partial [Pirellulaceae bacterium]